MAKSITRVDDTSGKIIIEIEKSRFGDFLSSVIGSKRQLSKRYNNYYLIDKEWVGQFISLVSQKVKLSNDAQLISSEITVYYEKWKEVSYFDVSSFLDSADPKNELTTGITVALNFLVEFPYSDTPEAQRITLTAISNPSDRKMTRPIDHVYDSMIYVSIDCTNVVWAEDIMNTVSGKIESDFSGPGLLNGFTQRIIPNFGSAAILITILVAMFIVAQFARVVGYDLEKMESLRESATQYDRIEMLLDWMLKTQNFWFSIAGFDKYFFFLLVGIVGIGAFLLTYNRLSFFRYVALNDKSVKEYRTALRTKTFLKVGVIFSLLLGIASSLVASGLTKLFES